MPIDVVLLREFRGHDPDVVRRSEVLRRDGFGADDARVAATQLVGLWRGLQFLTLTGVDPDELRAANRATVHALLTRR